MIKYAYALISVLYAFLAGYPALADTLQNASVSFHGHNVYSPTIIREDGLWKMWYSGWQSPSDFPNDRIFYRVSADGVSWNGAVQVLGPADMPVAAGHIGDPSVTVEVNSFTGQKQYTMFYTVCVDPCGQIDNQVWSSVSNDGLTWGYPQLLVSGEGAGEPSAVLDVSGDGRHWRVYFGKRVQSQWNKVHMVNVNGNRQAMAAPVTVHERADGALLGNPEVRQIDGAWHLFYNVFMPPNQIPFSYDIYKSVASTNTSWGAASGLVLNQAGVPNTYCSTTSPGVSAATAGSGYAYDIFFGNVISTATGNCDLSQNLFISRWRFTIP